MYESTSDHIRANTMRIIYLAVNVKSGAVDYGYIEYDLREPPGEDDETFRLIAGWGWRPFKILPLEAPGND